MMRRALTVLILMALLLLGARLVTLPSRPAPPPSPLASLASATAWLNTSEPITSGSLDGRVMLVVFWAYSNAQTLEVLPILTQWSARYRDHGLEIVAVHTPEFPFERSPANVQQAVERLGISCPVAVDSDRRIWTAFHAYEWPSYYVADPDGVLIGFQAGAGREPEVELYLRGLLTEQGHRLTEPPVIRRVGLRSVLGQALRSSQPDFLWSSEGSLRSPEMRFQLPVGEWFTGPQAPVNDQPRVYQAPDPLPLHTAALDGVWQFDDDRVRVIGPTGRFVVHYRAARCHLVVEGEPGMVLEVQMDGARSLVVLDQPRAYTVTAGAPADAHTLEVTLPRGAVLYACTFS